MTWPISIVSGTRKSRCSMPYIQTLRIASILESMEGRQRPTGAARREWPGQHGASHASTIASSAPGSGIIDSPLSWGDQLDGPSPIAATRSWQRTSPALIANKLNGSTMVTLHSLQCIGMASDYDVLAVFLRSTAKNFSGQPCIVRY